MDFRALVWKRTSNSYNISSFWICSIKAHKCLRTYYKLSWKYPNTTEIISKVTITLSLINSNTDFDFVGWVIKTPCLFYFGSVKFHYVKETRDINSLLMLVKIVLASQQKRQPSESLSRFVDNWKHRLGLESARAALCMMYVANRISFPAKRKNIPKTRKTPTKRRRTSLSFLVEI